MKSFILSIMLFSALFSGSANAAVKVYKGVSRYSSDVICTVREAKVYKKTSSYSSDVVCTIRDGKIVEEV